MPTDKRVDLQGHWALVTGASSGIGREFAVQLAARKVNLVLVARREERLQVLAMNLRQSRGIQVFVIPMDLASTGAALRIRQILQENGIAIRLLINNAGLGQWTAFADGDIDSDRRILGVNVQAVVELSRVFLPILTSHPTSAIINVSSQAAYHPMPFMSVYGASKAFVHSFSQALSEESRGTGLVVQTLVPGPTRTEIIGANEQSSVGRRDNMADPERPVRIALACLEKASPIAIAAKGVFFQRLFALLPASWVLRIVARMFRPPYLGAE